MPSCEARAEVTGKPAAGDGCRVAQPTMPSACGDSGPGGWDAGIPAWPLVGKRLRSQRAPWETHVHTDGREAGGLGTEARVRLRVVPLPWPSRRRRAEREHRERVWCGARKDRRGRGHLYLALQSQSEPGWELALMDVNIPSVLKALLLLGLLRFSLLVEK